VGAGRPTGRTSPPSAARSGRFQDLEDYVL